jgi:hypothetical protein
MATQRFGLRENTNGYWTVYDVFTGQPVIVRGVAMDRLLRNGASDMVGFLNYQDAKRRGVLKLP